MSLTISKLKFLASLNRKKLRQEHGLFVVEGTKLAEEALVQKSIEIDSVFALPEWLENNEPLLRKRGIEFTQISTKELSRISSLKSPNQVFVVCQQPDFFLDKKLITNDLTLYLDKIRDPGNLGTIIRIADWFGIRQVILSEESVEIFNPKTVQSTMGAIFRINVFEKGFFELKNEVPEAAVYASAMGGENIFKLKNIQSGIIVIGNESHGVSKEILETCTAKIGIPSHAQGGSESLNAAVATGIICGVFRNLSSLLVISCLQGIL